VLLFAGVGPLRMRPVVSLHDLGDLGAKIITSSLSPHQQASSLDEGAQPRSPRTGTPDGESRGAHRRCPCSHASPQPAIGPMPPLLAVAATHGSQCRAGAPCHLSVNLPWNELQKRLFVRERSRGMDKESGGAMVVERRAKWT
jgi:hypothetical protein